MKVIRTILSVLLGIALLPIAKAQQSDTEPDIRRLEEKVNAAYAANDLPLYFSFYSSTCVLRLPGQRIYMPEYKKLLTALIRMGWAVESAHTSDMQIQVAPAGDSVVASFLLNVKIRHSDGTVEDEDSQESDVWRKFDGTWGIAERHSSPVTKKNP